MKKTEFNGVLVYPHYKNFEEVYAKAKELFGELRSERIVGEYEHTKLFTILFDSTEINNENTVKLEKLEELLSYDGEMYGSHYIFLNRDEEEIIKGEKALGVIYLIKEDESWFKYEMISKFEKCNIDSSLIHTNLCKAIKDRGYELKNIVLSPEKYFNEEYEEEDSKESIRN
jgi:hypothetical protein